MASGSGVEKTALANSGNAVTQANNAYSTINPIYSEMATGNDGLTPTQKANLRTSSIQTLGGSQSAATGAGALLAARTGNAGAATAAIDDSARNAQAQQSQNELDIENKDADVARQNQQIGLAGLSSIYDDANKTGADYLGTAQSASANKRSSLYGLLNPLATVAGASKYVTGK